MRKLSFTLLFIAISFMAMGGQNTLKFHGKIDLRHWSYQQRSVVPVPIKATLEDNYIEVQFFKSQDSPVTFQIKDKQGNVIFQDITLPNEKEIYKITLDNLEGGQYELFYIEEDIVFRGEFEVE